MTGYKNFIEVCESSCTRHGPRLAYRYFHKKGGEESLSFAALRENAVALAARLQGVGEPGDRALIICPQGMDYIRALWGCLYSGLVAVPAYNPRRTHHFERLQTIVQNAQARVVLLTSAQLRSVRHVADTRGLLSSASWVIVDDPARDDRNAAVDPGTWVPPVIEPGHLALIQYTSGSTTAARGVMISHRNLLANQEMIDRAFRPRTDAVSVLWIPLFHDMGLMSLLQGVYAGFSSHLMSPLDFLASPNRWLASISDLGATHTAAPDFAYRLCVEKVTDEQLAELDLSSLETAINGSEPVSARNLDAFVKRFARCGFRRAAFFPSYGLAEATLLVSGRRQREAPRLVAQTPAGAGEDRPEVARVACGLPADGCEVQIVDVEGRCCPAGQVGEIWVKGAHVASGYWNNPGPSRETFGAITADGEGPFLRTGDLGYLHEGEIVVTGRIKDLIIVRGVNYYPNDIEETSADAHPQLVSGGCAAFLATTGELCVVAEVKKGASLPGQVEEAIVSAVSETHGLSVDRVVLVKHRTIPRTSSGKIQRRATKRALDEDALHVVHRPAPATGPENAEPTELQRLLAEAGEKERPEILTGFLLSLLAERLKVPFYRLSRNKSVAALGLDSIALIHLKQKLETELPVELPTEMFFADGTVQKLGDEILRVWKDGPNRPPAPARQATRSGPFAATLGQVALWALQQRDPGTTSYNEGLLGKIEGTLDLACLGESLQVLVARHPALRTTFRETRGQLWQDVAPAVTVQLRSESVESEEQALAAARAVLDSPFQLERETWRCRLICGPQERYLVFAVHHILFDMWSFGIFLEELTATYEALVEGEPLPYPAVDQGGGWLNRARPQADPDSPSEARERDLAYWREALAGAPATSRFPPSSRPRGEGRAARRRRFVLSRSSLAEVKEFARTENLTLSQVLLSAFFLLLNKYSGQDDLVIGIPLLGRIHRDSLRALGYFVNMAPVRLRGIDQTDVLGLMRKTRQALEDARRHQAIPFARLVDQWGPGGGDSWVQTSFSMLSSQWTGRPELAPFLLGAAGGRLRLATGVVHSCPHERQQAQFDLGCTVMEQADELHGYMEVRDGLYDDGMLDRLIEHYRSLLRAMVRSGRCKTRFVSLVGESEGRLLRQHLRRVSAGGRFPESGSPVGGFPETGSGASVVEWFRTAASRHGSRSALVGPTSKRSYADLENESERIARALVELGLGREDRVALAFADRATQTLAALSVLKASGIFVPLDLEHPTRRLSSCLRDSQTSWILADAPSAERMEPIARNVGGTVLLLHDLAPRAAAPTVPLPRPARGQDIAYCIYTSGSTGVPKGVSVPHRGLRNLVRWHVDAFGVDSSARASLIAGSAFDVAVWEVWPYLCTGGTLVEPPAAVKTVAGDLARWLRDQRLTHSFVPTALVELLLESREPLDLGELRYLLTAGDRLRVAAHPDSSFRLINAYGPTENSVITTAGQVVAAAGGDGLPDIGEPVSNQDLYILDRHGNEVPLGLCGELYIGGRGLAREYHRRPARTAERFVPDPFSGEPGSRIYASGDLVRLAENGRIHFVARNDDQVKIRGHRVELGEIEAILIRHPAVRQCKVVVQESPAVGKWIAAYLSPTREGPEIDEALRSWLGEYLPGYMAPSAFQWLDELPTDANGKIDKKQLPLVVDPGGQPRPLTPFLAPLEEEVAQLYSEILGIARVVRDDDFFALGGHSLLAGKLVQRVHAHLGVPVAMADVFAHPRVHELAARLRATGAAPVARHLEPLPRPALVPLSSAQKRLWFLQRLNPQAIDYNLTGLAHVQGAVDLSALESAFQQVVARHESLRTRFPEHEGTPCQDVVQVLRVPLECVALDLLDDRERDLTAHRILRAWEAEPFSLEQGPLIRTRFIRTASDEDRLFVSIHHIVADGRSLETLLREVSSFYRGEKNGSRKIEPPPVTQYVDYTLSCLTEPSREKEASDLRYWKEHLANLPPKLSIPSLLPAVKIGGEVRGDEIRQALPASLVEHVRGRARAWETTEFSVYLATLALLLGKTSDEERFLVGMAYEGRDLPHLQGAVGFFVNILPILVEVPRDGDFHGLLHLIRTRCARAMEHGHASYESIVHNLRSGRESTEPDLIQVMFDFDQLTPEGIDLGPTRAVLAPRADTSAKFDLTFRCRLGSGEATIACNYRRQEYGWLLVESLLDSYLVLLGQVVVSPEVPLADLRLVDEATTSRLLKMGAGPERALPSDAVVPRFETLARVHPDRLALVSPRGDGETEQLTYGALNATANRLAHVLRDAGLARGDVGAVCLAPGPAFVVSALAILKLGAAYAAIDPGYPARRARAILDDCRAPVLIIDDARFTGASSLSVLAWSTLARRLAEYPAVAPEIQTTAEDPLYVVYTSGTTGTPKGVVIPERGLANLCQWHARAYGLEGRGEEIRAGQTAGIGFDAAVWEIWPYLLAGASVWFAPSEVRMSSREMARWLTEVRITHVFVSTPLVHELLGDGWRGSADLRFLLTGGERLIAWAPVDAEYRLINHYGPSENAVVATAGPVAPRGVRSPPIGKPIDNVQALVLDRDRHLVPAGLVGELYLAGSSLMSGYRSDPDLTEHKRVVHPFAADGARMYRTGDRVCWNEHGELEYLGRVDDQLKIRGFRIEPGEILQALSAHPDVRSAVVKPAEHPVTGLHLAAYLVLQPGATAGAEDIRGELAETLPTFMVPSILSVLDALPLTSNGKVDLARLPAPSWDETPVGRPLATATERAIGAIWSDLLGTPVEDAGANFFTLGGHSLLAARAVAAIESELARECTLQSFLASSTLAELAETVDAGAGYVRIPRARSGQGFPLSPLQRRLWLVQQFAPRSTDYNVVGALELKGPVDFPSLRWAVGQLVRRHAVLRTQIRTVDGEPRQEILSPAAVDEALLSRFFTLEDSRASSRHEQDTCLAERTAELGRAAYDLRQGPLFRLVVLRFDHSRAALSLSVHHIVVDGWSVRVLLRDLFELYRSAVDGRAPDLPHLPVEYADYSLWAVQRMKVKERELLSFWEGYLHDRPAAALLPHRRPQPGSETGTGQTRSLTLGEPISARLDALAREQRLSLFELLFAVHVVWLYQLTRGTDLIVGAPFHQRGRPELENLAGFFVNILPVRSRFARSWTFRRLLEQVQETLTAAHAHHELPFDRIAEHAGADDEPLIQTLFDLRQERPFEIRLGDLSVKTLIQHVDSPIADLAVTLAQGEDGLTWSCTFRPELFSQETVAGWGDNFRTLIESVLDDVERPIRELPLRRPERRWLPDTWGHADLARSDETLLVQLARQVATFPSRPALTAEQESFSYAELDLATNQIAHYLREQGIGPGASVGVAARHGLDSILTILGVMKVGAFYVPIDLDLPDGRVQAQLADAGCEHLLAGAATRPRGFSGQVVAMERERWASFPRHLLGVSVLPEYPVYLAYTSGTTGEPKASILTHRGISNYVNTVRERFQITSADRFLLFAPLGFDASLEEIFVPLSSGASLHVGPPESKSSVAAMVELYRRAETTVLILPTAYWRLLAEHVETVGVAALPTVRMISIGGERATLPAVRQWADCTDGRIELWNIYGPSECSIGCVVDRLQDVLGTLDGRDFIPLRHPVANVELYVLDGHLDPVPPGVDGEVFVGGVGLAHGYHRRPALTAEKFLPDPFGKPGSRLYRTGDLVCPDQAGEIQFVGRADFQVKIDGVRVEPGEVEASLEQYPAVAKAVVIPERIGSPDNHLIAYVTCAQGSAETAPENLLAHLRDRLPAYMVPAVLHVLDEFPLTRNQKIDRAALSRRVLSPRGHVPAATETERLLLSAWQELLPDGGFGVTDDFFSLGGGSLLVIRLITRIEVQTAVRLTVRDIFEHPTIRGLAQLIEHHRNRIGQAPSVIPRTDRKEIALSGAQARLWYLQQFEQQSSAYHVTDCVRLEGPLRRSELLAAIRTTIAGNESLRTVFRVRDDVPRQVVLDGVRVEIREHDLGRLGISPALDRAAELGRVFLEQPFSLEQGPLCHFHLIRIRPELHVFMAIFHHIVIDGWSVQLWNQRLTCSYNALCSGEGLASPETERTLQYRDFSEWQRRLLDGGERERQLAYWSKVLAGTLPSLELPTDFVRPSQPSDRGDVRSFRIDDELAARLASLGQERQVSRFMVLLSAYFCLLHRYSNQADFLVAIPALGRARPELEEVIGFFVNTLVIRCQIRRDMPFVELLTRVRDTCLDALDHQDVPLEEVAARADAPRHEGRRAIFQTMFSFHEGERTGWEGLRGLRASSFDFPHRTSKFELYLATWTTREGLVGALEFRTDLFVRSTIDRMAGHLQALLSDLVATPLSPVAHLRLLSRQEYDELVHAHDGSVKPPPPGTLAHQLFEQRVAAHPERRAVTHGSEQLTYAELNRRANLVANELIARGARPEDRVVLLLGRDVFYLIALLACLKSGTAFVPMDPSYPAHRRISMIRQGAARFIVSESRYREQIDEMDLDLPVIEMGEMLAFSVDASHPRARNPGVPLKGTSLAYVINTSGSTGKPKGAMIEHRGMLNHLLSKVDKLALTESDVVAEMAATTFDVSVWQYLVALLAGGRTAIIPGDAAWLPRELLAELEREKVTIFESVPSHMKIVLDEVESSPEAHPLPGLRTYISNAEALTPEQCRRWLRRLPHVSIINTYGATECSDDTSHLAIAVPPSEDLPYMPIHGTIPNLTTYVLDPSMQPTPTGVPGEIFIGGLGVGRGYVRDPARTAQALVPDPHAPEPGRRFYKTGDLGRPRPGGVLEFLGRVDFQVKIRGQRVEMGEIEATLGAHENLRDVLVSATPAEHGGLYLLAYVVPERHPAPTARELEAFVRTRLAEAMVPAAFVFMDEFPLNANGKVDRAKLPRLSDDELFNRHDYVPPSTDTERELANLWTSVLEVDEVGALDGFFELGGHSLLAAELMIKIRRQFGIDISLKEFFERPNVRDLGALLDGRGAQPVSPWPAVKRHRARPSYDLAPCQIPEWYAYQVDPTSPVYNICFSDLFLRGDLDRGAFLRAWQSILDRHDILHVRFGYRDGKPFQAVDRRVVLTGQDVFLERLELVADDEVLAEANRLSGELGAAPFDFEEGPLFRLHLVTYGSGKHQLIFVIHHIIWDETSLINLMVELSELYNACREEREPELPQLKASYFDYVEWMHESLASGALEASKRYWLSLYETVPPPLDLPTDFPRPDIMSFRGDAIETWLPRRTVHKVESFLKRNEVTLFMLKLAIVNHYLHWMTGQDDLVIGCPIAGRSHPDFKPLLGLFATPMPIRCNIEAGMTFRELLRHVSRRTLDAFDHFQYPSNQLIEQLFLPKDLSRPRLFSVMFGVQNDKTEVVNRLSFHGLELSFEDVIDTENKTSRFDLNFVVDQFGSDIKFSCIYNTDLFHKDTVALMLENMTALLDVVLDDPDKLLHRYGGLSSDGETGHGMAAGPAVSVDARATMHRGFEQQAARTPDRPAVLVDDDLYTYRELNRRANRLARYLRSTGVENGQAIVVLHEPSIEMIVSLLAVLKSGCCYVPVVPDHPPQWVAAILRDTGAQAVLTTTRYAHRFADADADLILVDDLVDLLACYTANDLPAVDPGALAYILYTSGTTGQPRGVQIEHRGVANMLAAVQHEYALGEDDRVLFHTPFTFDVTVQEVFWPLAFGGTVVVAPEDLLKAAREVAGLIDRQSVTFVEFVPVMLEALVDARRKGNISALPSLRQVICGGAVLSKALNDGYRASFSAPLANHYGPTEVTVDASRFDCRLPFIGDSTPIGRPLANMKIFVLGAEGEPVPRGIIGEIHVASPGLARGYLHDRARTEEVFVELEIDGARRLYKTGDLGRYDRDGLLYFHGRRDRQVKVRGNRVEIDEIAGVLASHPDIAVAAIRWVKDDTGGGRLVAYIEQVSPAAAGRAPLDRASVREFLKQSLPGYMVPEWVHFLPSIPRTESGKIDEKRLPDVDVLAGVDGRAAETRIQKDLVAIMQQILGITAEVGITDDFFVLGGQSLKAVEMISEINDRYGSHVDLREFYREPTVEHLERLLTSNPSEG